jgi:hypothetical protein
VHPELGDQIALPLSAPVPDVTLTRPLPDEVWNAIGRPMSPPEVSFDAAEDWGCGVTVMIALGAEATLDR